MGIAQGLTEFLPVSSSGHLVLLQKIFNIKENTLIFDVLLHVATLVPVLIIFRKKILNLIFKPFQKYNFYIILSTIPAAAVAFFFGSFIESLFTDPKLLWLAFFLTSILILFADNISKKNFNEKINFKKSLMIGLIQAIAIIPGISRSGSTLSSALLCKMKKKEAIEFVFLISIPAIVGAFILQAKKICLLEKYSLIFNTPIILGFLCAMLSGYLSIKFMINLIHSHKLKLFSYYLFIISFLISIDQFYFKIFF
ncbi:MAG: undecaprenyl-diphosphate phosphatase [Clostridiales bacterium]|nr:undecaprenyl-diphosphate phosphatase [Clostridiales bacterium]